jgi:hypothetical protein
VPQPANATPSNPTPDDTVLQQLASTYAASSGFAPQHPSMARGLSCSHSDPLGRFSQVCHGQSRPSPLHLHAILYYLAMLTLESLSQSHVQAGERFVDIYGYQNGIVNGYAQAAAEDGAINGSNTGSMPDYSYSRGCLEINVHVG